jgi:hypothetical protein
VAAAVFSGIEGRNGFAYSLNLNRDLGGFLGLMDFADS